MSTENPYAAPVSFTPPVALEEPRDYPLASRWARFAGWVIDTLALLSLLIVLLSTYAFAYIIAHFDGSPEGIEEAVISGSESFRIFEEEIVGDLLEFAIYLGMFLAINGYTLAKRGQTIGKIVMRTRIVDRRGQIPNFIPLFLKRYVSMALFGLIPGIGQIVGTVNVLAIFRSNRQCMHDDLAGTRVVQL